MNIWYHFASGLFTKVPLNEPVDELGDYDFRIRKILLRHVAALGWWSTINIILAVICFFIQRQMLYYFLMMGFVWGVINFFTTILLTRHAVITRFKTGTVFERTETQHHVEKLLLFNAGLDISYIVFGLYLHAAACSAPTNKVDLYTGFACNIIMQGIFLFILDIRFFLMHTRNYRKAKAYLKKHLK